MPAHPRVGFPTPPTNALPLPNNGVHMPIYYNQPVVLQCLNTAVVSPIMVIRKVEKGNHAIGGGTPDPYSSRPAYELPTAPGETLGDAVSQLHRIALEVIPDPIAAYGIPSEPLTGFAGGGSYLSCLGENVGVRKAEGIRTQYASEVKGSPKVGNQALGNVSPDGGSGEDPFDVMLAGHAAALAAKEAAMGAPGSRGPKPGMPDPDLLTPITNDGGKVKRGKKGAASLASPIAGPIKGRKRGNSSSGLASAVEAENVEGVWTQDAGEAGTWTIVGTGATPSIRIEAAVRKSSLLLVETDIIIASTEIARHTFYIPPICFDGLTPYKCKATGCPDSFLTPIPSIPLSNVPLVRRYLVNQPKAANARSSTAAPSLATLKKQRTISQYDLSGA